nr:PREDICTED: neuronal acetylcholine receptor subunit alpha-9-like [Saccoglossus kowalevskii]
MMPRTSDEIPLIGQYYAATMFLISISTAMNVAVLNVNERGALGVFEVPRWIRIVVLKYMATLVFMSDCSKSRMIKTASLDRTQGNSSVNSKYYVQRDCSGNSTGSMNNRHCRMPMGTGYNEQDMLLEDRSDHTTLDGCSDRRLHRLEKTVDLILRHLKTAQRRKEKYTIVRQEWALVATVLDRVLLTMFVLCTGITTLTLLLQRQGPLIPFDPFDEYAVFDLEQYQPNIAYDT